MAWLELENVRATVRATSDREALAIRVGLQLPSSGATTTGSYSGASSVRARFERVLLIPSPRE